MFPRLGMTYLARQQHAQQRRGARAKAALHHEEMAMIICLSFVVAASMGTVALIMWTAN